MIVGDSKDGDEPWYFSLNNRRLWVLKALRAEGGLGPANTGEPEISCHLAAPCAGFVHWPFGIGVESQYW